MRTYEMNFVPGKCSSQSAYKVGCTVSGVRSCARHPALMVVCFTKFFLSRNYASIYSTLAQCSSSYFPLEWYCSTKQSRINVITNYINITWKRVRLGTIPLLTLAKNKLLFINFLNEFWFSSKFVLFDY